jgi:isopenicillin N synthase-like dioxygenase
MSTSVVPVIDISPFLHGTREHRGRVAEQVAEACTDTGFLVISGHGVDPSLVADMFDKTRRFFELPLVAKESVKRPDPSHIRGYSGIESESFGLLEGEAAPPDLREIYDVGPTGVPAGDPYYSAEAAGAHFAPNLWPSSPDGFEVTYRAYYAAMEALTLEIFQILSTALNLPDRFFDDKVDRHISILRGNYYPRQLTPPRAKQIRGGGHTDYTAFTILWQEDVPAGGLQIRTRDGEWIDVPALPGTFVVNIGDSMMRWTNDTWISTMHRVVNPPPEIAREHSRISFAYFVQPNYDAAIECIDSCTTPLRPAKYPPVRNGEYLSMKFSQQNDLVGAY